MLVAPVADVPDTVIVFVFDSVPVIAAPVEVIRAMGAKFTPKVIPLPDGAIITDS